MKSITYNLRGKKTNSNEYYQTIHHFSKKVYNEIERKLGSTIEALIDFIEKTGIEKPRSRAEYAVEILTIGMTWNRYFGASQKSSKILIKLLSFLYKIRSTSPQLKPLADKVRGTLTCLFIVNKINQNPKNKDFSFLNYNILLNWLQAIGEFNEEVKRMKIWYHFFRSNALDSIMPYVQTILEIFDWFRCEAKLTLGKYTADLEIFLKTEYLDYKFREDVIFCGKEEVEYHLNMVGSEIINWGFAPSYQKTETKVLLVPGCMRINNGETCKAKQVGLDIRCTSCHKDCNVNNLVKVGKKNNFEVNIVPHSSSFTKWLKKWENSEQTGLVAVACLLNLVPGGYEMRELNIPAQCLLLDFCGCKKHWHKKGIVTEINEERLLEIIT